MTGAVLTSMGDVIERGRLAADVRAVRIGDDLVLLDLSSDDYLLLDHCGPVQVRGSELVGPLDTLMRLSAEELLQSGVEGPGFPAPPSLPVITLPVAEARPTLKDVVVFMAIWLDAVRHRPTVQRLSRKVADRSGDRTDFKAIGRRVEVFRRLLPWAPWTGACLLQAELLLRFLNAGGLDAEWVFGVRTWPFMAHCWLQVGDVCVSQSADTLAIYRPIMVV